MKNYYAKQFKVGTEVKVHTFKSMQERDAWVEMHYDDLGARQCSAVEAKQLVQPDEFIEHYKDSIGWIKGVVCCFEEQP